MPILLIAIGVGLWLIFDRDFEPEKAKESNARLETLRDDGSGGDNRGGNRKENPGSADLSVASAPVEPAPPKIPPEKECGESV